VNILDPVTEPKILSLLLTLQCTAECSHCGTGSSPRVKDRLSMEKARALIEEAASLSYNAVVFTGGEPTLYGKGLYELVALATKLKFPTRVVTNAHWAKNLTQARAQVQLFANSGLKEINYSTGDEHARFVPTENIVLAARAAMDVGLPTAIMIEVVHGNTITKEKLVASVLWHHYFSQNETASIRFCESPWMPLEEMIFRYPEGLATNSHNIGSRSGCDSIINTTTVMGNGKIMACCGLGTLGIPELELSHVNKSSLAGVTALAEADFLKRWIRNEGPERILQWAATKNPEIKWENQYAHKCQACRRLYSDPLVKDVINSDYEEKIDDVLMSEWLIHQCGTVPIAKSD
jgi:organic radical activating enzyme